MEIKEYTETQRGNNHGEMGAAFELYSYKPRKAERTRSCKQLLRTVLP
jgi:hypothetical protein